jgi:ankyrin repeat protein
VYAAEAGDEAAVALMLEVGFPVGARRNDDGATALHATAYAGHAGMVRLLLDSGADIDALDGEWHSPPLDWALVGSGVGSGQLVSAGPPPDWVDTVRVLLAAGASAAGISLSPDDPKAPSPEVAALLRAHGAV